MATQRKTIYELNNNWSASNTSHVHFSRGFLLPQDAAVLADVLGLHVSDVHLGHFISQRHLVSSAMAEQVLALVPLYWHPSPGHFTAEGHVASLTSLLVFQGHFEGEWYGCGGDMIGG